MSIWAEAQDAPKGIIPAGWKPGQAPSDPGVRDAEDAHQKYLAAFGNASAFNPNAQASSVQGATIESANAEQARAYQTGLADKLALISSGPGGGVAEAAARANLAAGAQANNAFAATRATPGGAAMSMRMAGNPNQAMAAGGEARIAALKAQEQLAAQSALGNVAAGMRAQDFGMANEQAKLAAQASLANAGFAQQTALANQQAWQQQQALKRAALGNMTSNDQKTWDHDMSRRKMVAGNADWDRALGWDQYQRDAQQQAAYLNTLGAGVTAYSNAYGSEMSKQQDPNKYTSDRREKTEIKEVDVASMMAALFGGE
jgi:hypothetical protein